MRYLSLGVYCLLFFKGISQNPIYIPDTLSGPTYSITMRMDSVQFLPGKKSYTYAYNSPNKYLGPTLFFRKGTNVSLVVKNQINDTTTVHWHGIHLPAKWDGGPHNPIYMGATWNPQFKVMDHAATYWYHPHMHMKTAEQAIKGATGLIIVRDSIERSLTLPRRYGIDDFPLVVQCQQYDSLNQAMPKGMQDSTLLVNGTMNPYVNLPAQVVRLRLLNASGERAFNFGFTANRQFYQIASDGGLLNAPILSTRVRLAPGERAEILVNLSAANGQTIHLMCYGSELPVGVQGGPTMPMPPGSPPMDSPLNGIDYDILKINVVPQTANPVTTIPTTLTINTPYLESQIHASRKINFTADSAMVMDGPFYFNDSTFNMMRIDHTIPLNSIEAWTLVNKTMMAHPFHIHDVQFHILNRNGIAPGPEEQGRKDVVFVLPYDSVTFITKFEDFADDMMPYMYHCHILMHEDDGMMGQFIVSSNPVGLAEIKKDKYDAVIYPNPTNSKIFFRDQINVVSVELVNSAGLLVYSSNSKKVSDEGIDLSGFTSGIYLLRINTGQGYINKKVIKN